MGATKLTNYTNQDLQLSVYGKVFSHPARIQILRGLLDQQTFRNLDLAAALNLNRTTVKFHLEFFIQAEIVKIEYFSHFYLIRLNDTFRDRLVELMNHLELMNQFCETKVLD